MAERQAEIADFLAQAGYAAWQKHPIAGDASPRRYERLIKGGKSLILMNAPPETAGDIMPFLNMAQFLSDHGFCSPDIISFDRTSGLILMTDLGQNDVAAWLRKHPGDEPILYKAATDVLVRLYHVTPPPGLTVMTPETGADMLGILSEHYTKHSIADLQAEMRHALAVYVPEPTALALRDYHAENLIWRAAAPEVCRIGLLDFQDAFLAPPGYDLASLLRDARRDVAPDIAADMVSYFASQTGAGPAFHTQISCLALQRNLRILGIFARLGNMLGKHAYLHFMPRVWNDIMLDLQTPELAQLKSAVLDVLAPPDVAAHSKVTEP